MSSIALKYTVTLFLKGPPLELLWCENWEGYENWTLRDIAGGSLVSDSCRQSLLGVANLLGLEEVELRRSLTSRVMTTTKGGAVGTIIKFVP